MITYTHGNTQGPKLHKVLSRPVLSRTGPTVCFLMPIETMCCRRHVVSMSIKISGPPEGICMGIKKQGAVSGTSFLWALKNEVLPVARRFYGH